MSNDPFGIQPQGPNFKRLLIAVVLMTAFSLLFGRFFGQPSEPKASSKEIAAPLSQPAKKFVSGEMPLKRHDGPKVTEVIETFFVNVKNNLGAAASHAVRGGFEIKFSNIGAQIDEASLSGYEEKVILATSPRSSLGLFGLTSRDSGITLPPDAPYRIVSKTYNSITMEHLTPEGVKISRSYTLRKDQFLVDLEIEVSNTSGTNKFVALDLLMGSRRGEIIEKSFFSARADDAGVVCKTGDKKERFSFESLQDEAQDLSGLVKFAGFDKQYFLISVMPTETTIVQGCSARVLDDAIGMDDSDKTVLISLHNKPFELAPGQINTLKFSAFLGPKQLSLLENAGHGLEENINFGWFGVISRPMLWLLVKMYGFTGNFGIAIIMLTLLIKLLTFPLTQKSFVSMQQMKKFQPEIKALQKKFGHDRTLLGQKQMELYKLKGINPLAGCLPMLIQMPVWFALYQMLWNSVELFQQPFWLWLTNLTAPDPYYVLPVVMGVTMLIQTAFQPTPQDQPQMKYMMWGMPIFFTFIMLNMPAGLSLYIFTNNILTIFQQLYIKRRFKTS